jgi:hypothetical protein
VQFQGYHFSFFVFASAAHIVLNWKPLVHHSRKAAQMMLTKEAGAALAVVLGIVGLFAGHALHIR